MPFSPEPAGTGGHGDVLRRAELFDRGGLHDIGWRISCALHRCRWFETWPIDAPSRLPVALFSPSYTSLSDQVYNFTSNSKLGFGTGCGPCKRLVGSWTTYRSRGTFMVGAAHRCRAESMRSSGWRVRWTGHRVRLHQNNRLLHRVAVPSGTLALAPIRHNHIHLNSISPIMDERPQ